MMTVSATARLRSCARADYRDPQAVPRCRSASQAAASRPRRHELAFGPSLANKAFVALKHFGRGLMAAREASAARSVSRHLAWHSDTVLLAAGFSSEEIRRLRDHRSR